MLECLRGGHSGLGVPVQTPFEEVNKVFISTAFEGRRPVPRGRRAARFPPEREGRFTVLLTCSISRAPLNSPASD